MVHYGKHLFTYDDDDVEVLGMSQKTLHLGSTSSESGTTLAYAYKFTAI